MLKKIRPLTQIISVVSSPYYRARRAYSDYRRKRMPIEELFADIFRENAWLGDRSVSGPGSDIVQTRIIIEELPPLFTDFRISTMLDIPCGDFHWMSTVDLAGVKYIGADIVKGLVDRNKRFETDNIRFIQANVITDELPKVDLVLCRDCLVHFSFADIDRALKNICRSDSTYLLTTTFPDRTKNRDTATGGWRVLNLEIEPFNLPAPLRIITEGCTEGRGMFKDKSLGLWRITDIKECLTGRVSRPAASKVVI